MRIAQSPRGGGRGDLFGNPVQYVMCRLFTSDLIGSIIYDMNAAAKLLTTMRRNQLDWQISQLQSVARQHGIDWRHNGTSHCIFIRADGQTLPVPAHRPIKPIYIKKFIALVDGA